jgi:hypothetical protein
MSKAKERADSNLIRRRHRRADHICLAWISVGDDSGATAPVLSESGASSGVARVIDLSPSGTGLICVGNPAVGTKIIVELLVLDDLRLRARGVIVHVTPHPAGSHLGISFDTAPVLCDAAIGLTEPASPTHSDPPLQGK